MGSPRVTTQPTQPTWGLQFPRPAAVAGGLELVTAPVPPELRIPLNQSIGVAAQALVNVGDHVDRGQPIAERAANAPSANVHASSSGTVTAIEPRPVVGGGSAVTVVIRTDGKDTPWSGYAAHAEPLHLPAETLRKAAVESGIVGMGGALFPTALKLNPGPGVRTLILNGVECEPRISCDDALMKAEAADILRGAQIMLRLLEADECVVALKANSPALETIEAAAAELRDDRFRTEAVPVLYPAGGELQLIQLLTGKEVPANGLPWDVGVVCHNVGTAEALFRFVARGEPLISRVTTISGGGITRPLNARVRIGTPIAELVKLAGGYKESAARLIMGGPMMGRSLPDDELAITKACNSLYVAAREELATEKTELPCIRCGECATVCPVNLMPQLLLQSSRINDVDGLTELGLPDCIECGCCDYVCPSHIPLTAEFRAGRRRLWEVGFEKRRARRAEQRYRARTERLQRDAAETDAQLSDQLQDVSDGGKEALERLLNRAGKTPDSDGQERQ